MAIEVNPDEDFHVALNGNVVALSLNALDIAYQGDRIDESTLIWQPGFAQWMRLDAVLAELEGQDDDDDDVEPAEEITDEVYFVMVAEGDIKQMSLDLLNDAYRMEIISDDTLVWQPGYTEWIPLAVLLGGAPEQHVSIAPSMVPAAPQRPGLSIPLTQTLPGPVPTPSTGPIPTTTLQGFGPPASAGLQSTAPQLPSPAFGGMPASSRAPSSAPMPYSPPPSSIPYAPASTAPRLSNPAPLLSTVPVALNIPQIPDPPPRPSPWYSRALVAAAACTMVFVANQNGVGAEVTHGFAEKNLPALSRSTPYGLSVWLNELTAQYHLDQLTDAQAIINAEAQAEEDRPPEVSPTPSTPEKSDSTTAAASAPSTRGNSSVRAFGAKLGNAPAPARRAPMPVTRSRSSDSSKKSTSKSNSGLPSTSDSYDPMNGAL